MKREIKKYLFDIKTSIDSINNFLGEKRDFFEYQENKLLRRGIERSLRDVDAGRVISQDDVKKKYGF